MARNLTALPSRLACEDGAMRELDQLEEEKRAAFCEAVCRSAGQALSDYFSAHPKEWEVFVTQAQTLSFCHPEVRTES